jgi:hypothetical protein
MATRIIPVPGPNVKLVLDHEDPHTPAMVWSGESRRDGLGNASSTYDCAVGTGWVDEGSANAVDLTLAQIEFLDSKSELVEQAYNTARRGMPEYM